MVIPLLEYFCLQTQVDMFAELEALGKLAPYQMNALSFILAFVCTRINIYILHGFPLQQGQSPSRRCYMDPFSSTNHHKWVLTNQFWPLFDENRNRSLILIFHVS